MMLKRRELLAISPTFAVGTAQAALPLRRPPMSDLETGSVAMSAAGRPASAERGARPLGIPSACRWSVDAGAAPGAHGNPSFLALDRDGDFLYAVHGDMTNVTSLRREADGRLVSLGIVGTGGANPVHLAADPTNRFMLIANYATGSVAALPRNFDGTLAAPAAVLALPGKPGPDPVEQRSSHPHQVVWDPAGCFVVVPDKGTDQIFVLRFDPFKAQFEICGRFATRPGSGPRHIAFHPTQPFAFVAYELSSDGRRLWLQPQVGKLDLRSVHRTIPADATLNTAAEILVTADGGEVLVTNRGHDSIYCAHFVAQRATLERPSWTSCGGQGPRFASFGLRPNELVVANELSDNIFAFDLFVAGRPARAPRSGIPTGSPVCIVMGHTASGIVSTAP